MSYKECRHCSTQNPENHNFCMRCGALLVRNCPRCNFELLQEANFCGNCGLGLTPQAQLLWLQNQVPLPASQIAQSKPRQVAGKGNQPTETAANLSASPSTSPLPLLDQYIPRELMSKLEAARRGGGMMGERRVVTMLFCDVKGSTAAAQHLDPEEWTEIINGAFEYMIKPVYRYEGTVARLMGDGILAFFGAPAGHRTERPVSIMANLCPFS